MGDTLHTPALAALVSACHYLAGRQERDGFWRDYDLPPGPSSEWVTAFVGYALLGARFACTHTESFSRALSALRLSCRSSGWGYNAAVAADADSTAWAVRSFVRANTEVPIEPISCLAAYVGPEGGARTFVCGPKYGRWTIEHVDVTAVLGLAMKEAGASGSALDRVRRWTLDQRNGDGLWTSFWWTFDAYATARVLEFLASTGGIPGDVVEASRCYVEKRRDYTTAAETANLLMMASRVGACPDAWIPSLLGCQRSDGGWPPSRVLKVPNQKTASEDELAFEDGNGLMSTAMAVMALTGILGKDS
jgi:hypothetical protein